MLYKLKHKEHYLPKRLRKQIYNYPLLIFVMARNFLIQINKKNQTFNLSKKSIYSEKHSQNN